MSNILCIAACYMLTHILVHQDGPSNLIIRFRQWASKSSWSPLHCLRCSSVWTAVPFAIYLSSSWQMFIIYWFAISAGVVLLAAVVDKLES